MRHEMSLFVVVSHCDLSIRRPLSYNTYPSSRADVAAEGRGHSRGGVAPLCYSYDTTSHDIVNEGYVCEQICGRKVVLVVGAVATLCLPSFDTKQLAQFVPPGVYQTAIRGFSLKHRRSGRTHDNEQPSKHLCVRKRGRDRP